MCGLHTTGRPRRHEGLHDLEGTRVVGRVGGGGDVDPQGHGLERVGRVQEAGVYFGEGGVVI